MGNHNKGQMAMYFVESRVPLYLNFSSEKSKNAHTVSNAVPFNQSVTQLTATQRDHTVNIFVRKPTF